MKKILLGLLLLSFFSCTKDAGLAFTDKDAVYFQYSYMKNVSTINFDHVVFSFGMKDDNIRVDTAKIVVKIMGNAADRDRAYHVRVVADSTTAVAGTHYEILNPLQKFGADKLQDTLCILVKRDALSSSHILKEEKQIKLELADSEDFAVGVDKGRYMKLRINNYLSEPEWWKNYEFYNLYFYHPEKWKVLMMLHDDFKKTGKESPVSHSVVSTYFNALRTYLLDIPTYDKETGQRILINQLVD